jgi:GNAT superfamily N-acetyltransferase
MARYEVWVEVPDSPGNLAALAGDLAACGANIVHLDVHAAAGSTVIDRLVVQVPGDHADRLGAVADRYGATLRPLDDPGGAPGGDGAGSAVALRAGVGAGPPPPLPPGRPVTRAGRSDDRDVGRRPPTTLERLVALTDGGLVRLRHLSAGDRDALVAHHLRCSAATRRHSRFLAPGALPAPIVVGEASPDGCRDHVALAALVGGDIVGAARYDREGTGPVARVAVIVEDRHQRRGIGSLLVGELAVLAANADLGCLRALAPGDDDALRGTLRRAGLAFTVRRMGDDTVLDCSLPHGLSATA